jgi:uncharacterized repeat protein (TIGR01451 family)
MIGLVLTSLTVWLPKASSARLTLDNVEGAAAVPVKRIRRITVHRKHTMHTATPTNTQVISAYQHLVEVMDKYHHTFDVYTDVGAGGNHFVHRAMIEPGVAINDAYTGTVHSGATAISNTFNPTATINGWGGWYFQNGVLLTGTTAPIDNRGEYPDAGYDLSGATALTFWARGAEGGEWVEFFAFGVGRDEDGTPTEDWPDSETKEARLVWLTNAWQLYTISLAGLDPITYVIGGFGWTANKGWNDNQSITFYLDDIQYNKPHLDDLRLPVSYETISSTLDFDVQMRNVAFTYDSALALCASIAMEDWERAELLADALVYAQQHDRSFADGRLRNAYQSGDLANPPGWMPAGAARLPGWWDPQAEQWIEDEEQVGSVTGNPAWAMIGLLNYYETWGGTQYLSATIDIGDWVYTNTHSDLGPGGYTGGFWGPDIAPVTQTWKSTEHNLDLYVAFERLYDLTGDVTWHDRALHARSFVSNMVSDSKEHFWTGTYTDGVTINKSIIPLDPQTWSLLAMGENVTTSAAIDFAERNLTATYTYSGDPCQGSVFEGFDFNDDQDFPWPEGTAQMIVAYWLLGEMDQAQQYLDELREVQQCAPNGNGKGIVASASYSLTTGLDEIYYNRLHVGATAWYIFAELKYNPYYAPLRADFVAVPTSEVGTLTAVFTNTSTGDYTASLWDFGDIFTSTQQHPTHTYTTPGAYTVTLTVSGLPGIDEERKVSYILVVEEPITGLTATNDSPTKLGDVTTLTATIEAGSNVAYSWNFDGKTGSGAVVTHTYDDVGTYTAIVTASNSVSVLTTTTTVIVEVIGLTITKYAIPDPVEAGAQLTFTIRVTNTGSVDLHATITDTLPEHVIPGGTRVWTATLPAPGGVWTKSFSVIAECEYSGTLTNTVQVTTEEGATGIYMETSSAVMLCRIDPGTEPFPDAGYCFVQGLIDPTTGLVASREGECFTTIYKNSLAAMAFIHEGDIADAEKIFDFFQGQITTTTPISGFRKAWDPCTGLPLPDNPPTNPNPYWEGDTAFLLLALNYYAQVTDNYGDYENLADVLQNYLTERAHSDDTIIAEGTANMYAALEPLGSGWDNWKTLSRLYSRFYDEVDYPNVADLAVRGVLVFGDTTGFGYLDNFERTEAWCCNGNPITAFAAHASEGFINVEISAQLLLAWRLWRDELSTDLSFLRSESEKLRLSSQQTPTCSGLPYLVTPHPTTGGFHGDYSLPIADPTAYLLYDYWDFNPFAPGRINAGCRYDEFIPLETVGQQQGFPRLFSVGQDFESFPQEINDGTHRNIVISFSSSTTQSLFTIPLTLTIDTVGRGAFTIGVRLDNGDHCLADFEPSATYSLTSEAAAILLLPQSTSTPPTQTYQLVLEGMDGWGVFDWLQLETPDQVLWTVGYDDNQCGEFDNDGFVYGCNGLEVTKQAHPDQVQAGEPLTYTIRVTNTGSVDLHATITDILPVNVTPGGMHVWTATIPAPSGVWTKRFTVTTEWGYGGTLTNVVQVTTEEAATGTYTHTISVEEPISGLSAINDSPTALEDVTTLTATIEAGSNVTYIWDFGDGETGSGAIVTHTYLAVGVYTAIVTASNSAGEVTATTTVTIDVPVTGPTATNDSPTKLGEVTTFTATIEAGSNVTFSWNFGDGKTGSGAIVAHTYDDAGVYTAVVTTSNSIGAVTATTSVTVDETIAGLEADNDSPTPLGQATTLTATITTGSNISYTWAFDDEETGSGAIVTHTYPSIGVYTAVVTASNSVSVLTATTTVIITNLLPVANAGADQKVRVNGMVTLDGSGSDDPDGHLPLNYGWTQTGGPSVTLSDATVVSPTFTTPGAPAVLTFTLTVTDAYGLADPTPDTVVIVVSNYICYLPVVSRDYKEQRDNVARGAMLRPRSLSVEEIILQERIPSGGGFPRWSNDRYFPRRH